MTESDAPVPRGEFLVYEADDGRTRVECRFESETLWLSQALMAELFETTPQNITLHLRSVFLDGEVDEARTCKDFLQVRQEGARRVQRRVRYYNLDAILSVGYRVRSARGAQFRRWATERLREYLVKGFTMDDERLKNPPVSAPGIQAVDYFDEFLERIRDIRASEKRMYLRVRDLFKLAADYRTNTEETTRFFRVMQNKLHFAVTGRTAAELVTERANADQPNMGLTSWSGGTVRRSDVTIAKNYLQADEIEELNRIVVMWLDFAEDQARRRKQVFLRDWEQKLAEFLRFNDRAVLTNAGKVTSEEATRVAENEYERFAERRRRLAEAEAEQEVARAIEEEARALPAPSKRLSASTDRSGKGRRRT